MIHKPIFEAMRAAMAGIALFALVVSTLLLAVGVISCGLFLVNALVNYLVAHS